MQVVDGATLVECGLCGERFGERHVLTASADRIEAEEHGYPAEIWPLVRGLSRLPGLGVEAATGGGDERTPAVTIAVGGVHGLGQLENVARSLRLASGALRHRWALEVDCEHHLVFVLRARAEGPWTAAAAHDARVDLETLAAAIERDRKLQWWHRGDGHR